MLLDGFGYRLAEGRKVRTALSGILAVDERGDVLAVALSVRDDALDVLALEVNGRVEWFGRHGLVDQVEQAVCRVVDSAVEPEGESGVEVGVVAHHGLDKLHVVGVVVEDLVIGDETYERTVLLGALSALVVFLYAL